MSSRSKHHEHDEYGFVRLHLDYGATAPFIFQTIFALHMLGDESALQSYIRAYPEAHRAILALSAAVTKAGVRVRDSHGPKDIVEEHLRDYTADELWLCDLAIDVVAMLGGSGGLGSTARMTSMDAVRAADKHVRGHHWKSEVRKAEPGPAEFRDLRAHVPHHQPH